MAEDVFHCHGEAKPPYPWDLFWRTCVLIVGYLLLGVAGDGLKGPTLLDLKDHYDVSISNMSFMLMLSAIGSLIGCLALGLMDKLKRYCNLILASQLALLGTSVILFPAFSHVAGLYSVSFLAGVGGGYYDAGGQVLLLDIWRGGDSGPYMHALHFMYGVGIFLGPVVARPFLSNSEEVDLHSLSNGEYEASSNLTLNWTSFLNGSQLEPEDKLAENDSMWTIHFLFPMIGSLPVLLSIVFILFFVLDEKKNKPSYVEESTEKENKDESGASELVGYRFALLAVIMTFFFLYSGQEVAFGVFIPVFAVKSKLGLSRQQGSDLSAVFWGVFAGTRGLAVPAAVFLPPETIMVTSFLASTVAAVFLAIYGESSVPALFGFTALLGFGMASIFATGMLWLEKRIHITNRIGSAMAISSCIGTNLFPVLVGQTLENDPISFMYINLAICTGSVLLFGVATLLARRLVQEVEKGSQEHCQKVEKGSQEHCQKVEKGSQEHCQEVEKGSQEHCQKVERGSQEHCQKVERGSQEHCQEVYDNPLVSQ